MNGKDYKCVDYVIKQGDSLYAISREHRVPLALILRVNPYVDIYNLQVGDELCIPSMKPIDNNNLSTYTVQSSESIQQVLDKTGLELSELLQYNTLSNMMLCEGTTLAIPASDMM
jgi:LysM repeat protein